MPIAGSYVLGDLVGRRDRLAWSCTRCGRAGEVAVAELVEVHGVEARLPDLRFKVAQAAGCDKRPVGFDVCDPIWRKIGAH